LTSGGEAGARLAATLGMATSPDTLLRVAKSAPLGSDLGEPIRVLGVDDWAWRRGQRYGTILVDLERGRVVDLLPTREPEPLIAWLQTHPEVAIVSRDRASGYADAVRRGAPAAIQVADRFHLLRNLTEALERTLERHQPVLRTVAPPASSLSTSTMAPARRRVGPVAQRAPQPRLAERRQAATRERRQARYEQVVSLHARGLSQLAIRRLVGVSRGTVIRWLTCGRFPERRPRSPRPTTLSEHAAYLRMRWAEGCHNASRLWRELRATRNFRGGQTTVRDWIQQHLRAGAPADAMPPPRHRPPRGSPRQTAWLLSAPADRLTESERAYLDALSQACPAIAMARALAAEFRRILREHDVNAFMPWLAAAEQSDLRSLATGLRRDRDAVLAAILLRWSNGPVEGHVHRLKLIKRTMYGRAGFPLLRQRVLAA
jgi:transposase